jgi:hypothetical protein
VGQNGEDDRSGESKVEWQAAYEEDQAEPASLGPGLKCGLNCSPLLCRIWWRPQ